MGSIQGNGQGRGPSRRRESVERRRRAMLQMESLERRTLLTNSPPNFVPTSMDVADVQHGPMANEGQTLIRVYLDYQNYKAAGQGGQFATSSMNSLRKYVKFSGDSVAVTIY